jgi:GT2 family glycosyltransferase
MRDETILCVATRTWDSLWRESQQIMSRMAKHNQIFYFEPGRDVQEPILKAFGRTWHNFFRLESRTLNENLILIPSPSQIPIGRRHLPAPILKVTMPLVVKLNARFLVRHMQRAVKAFQIKDPILWLYSPYHTDLIGKFGEKLSCYQNYDEFSEYIYNERISERVQKYDNQLCMSVDLVFATSRSQASRRKTLNPNTHFIPNGVDFDLFNRILNHPSPPPADITPIQRPIIGFVGWMGYHIDMDLLFHIGTTFPECSLVLIGPNDLPAGKKRRQLEALPNTYFLGNKEHETLPDYLQVFDVALMPYLINGHTRNAYPLKLHEYLASGRATVAVNLPELKPFSDVIRIADTPEAFVKEIRYAMEEDSLSKVQSRVQIARENTWDDRVNKMYQAMAASLSNSSGALIKEKTITTRPETLPQENNKSNPLVSVVIVTWNRKAEVLKTVQSVHDQKYKYVEIVVVDNASTDGTVEALRQAYPEIKVIRLEENLGASAGRNPGISAAEGEIVFLLDSDASLGKETIQNAVHKLQEHSEVGVIACKVVNADTKQLDRIAGWIYSEKDKVDQDQEFLSFSFSECGCAIRKEVLDEVGFFWDSLFFGGEGEELSLRIWDAGYSILYSPDSIIYHRVSQNQRVENCERQYYTLRNMLYIYLLRYPWWMLPIYIPIKTLISLIRALRRKCVKVILGALLDVLKLLPSLLKERQPIKSQTGRHYMRLQREHGPWRWDLVSWFRFKT